ncbi:hypothetical protein OBCHQ24_02940 [Oceanobacillus iheyensis]|nr:hypothetical protein OBCHQ24_02940 [Oceanobacillus iheyensis]
MGDGDPLKGTQRAKVWADAHETTSSGLDREMDLINNEIGRYHAYLNFSASDDRLESELMSMIAQGGMVRLVGGILVPTNELTGK